MPLLSSFHSPVLGPTRIVLKEPLARKNHSSDGLLVRPIEFNLSIESPPLICYGAPAESTGALLSGLLFFYVNTNSIEVSSATLELVQEITVKRPSIGACKKCITRESVLRRWDVLTRKATFPKSEYGYPFSYLLPGSLPATTVSGITNIQYFLRAQAVPASKDMAPITLTRAITLYRSLATRSDDTRRCLRIFPPTNLNVTAQIPSVCFPKSSFNVEMQLNNINNREKHTKWVLRKFNWRVEEICKLAKTACSKHIDAPHPLEETKLISAGECRRGWKTDNSNDGRVDLQFEVSTFTESTLACNVSEPAIGYSVEHLLVVEMLVAEEHLISRSHTATSPTGTARILRMQFNLEVTERGGLGISWDDEVPPTYEDVPVSPPGYDYLIEQDNIEHLTV
ncbi:hypothetical protein V1511DRAFT_494847 [Dipodascopsis uninucleata]